MTPPAVANHSTARCRSCDALIYWAVTTTGRRMPVDAEPDPAGNLILSDPGGVLTVRVAPVSAGESARYRPHFATCPNAKDWRR